ncbi:MAG: Methyltransferase type 11 [Rhizobium sp.]|nr:Methyltransferase type 11 [Rhizobium sp.]
MNTLHIADAAASERAKYDEIWGHAEYKKFSPGLENVERFINVLEPYAMASLIDVGCGAGVAGLEFQKIGFRVTWLDLSDAGLDQKVDRKNFIQSPIWSDQWALRNKGLGWDYGFCCDVMEHIPTEYTTLCLDRIIKACRTTWFQIALHPDEFGAMIGKPLHLTVQPFKWWLERIASLGNVIEARDLCGTALFVVNR